MPTEEQFDKEKAKAEVQALDSGPNNDKPPPTPALSLSAVPGVPGVQLTGAEKEKYEAEMAKLYKEMDDKVRKHLIYNHWSVRVFESWTDDTVFMWTHIDTNHHPPKHPYRSKLPSVFLNFKNIIT